MSNRIDVTGVWYDPHAGVGRTAMLYRAPADSKTLRGAATSAALAEMRRHTPHAAEQPVAVVGLDRGQRHPDGRRHVFADWVVGEPTPPTLRVIKDMLLRAYAWLNRKKGGA